MIVASFLVLCINGSMYLKLWHIVPASLYFCSVHLFLWNSQGYARRRRETNSAHAAFIWNKLKRVADQLRERHLWPLPWGWCIWCAVSGMGGSGAQFVILIGNTSPSPPPQTENFKTESYAPSMSSILKKLLWWHWGNIDTELDKGKNKSSWELKD